MIDSLGTYWIAGEFRADPVYDKNDKFCIQWISGSYRGSADWDGTGIPIQFILHSKNGQKGYFRTDQHNNIYYVHYTQFGL